VKENTLRKNLILKNRDDITETLKAGRRFEYGAVKIILFPDPGQKCLKVAFLVSKRLGRRAVLRNKIKRWLREIFRNNKKYFPQSVRIILTSPLKYEGLSYDSLKNDFLEVVRSERFTDFVDQILSKNDISVQI
jgi:ribonuclease P protein component